MVEELTLVISNWVVSYASFYHVVMVLLGVFFLCAFVQGLTNKGPMLWPVMGIIPTVLFHTNDVYDWATEALIRCGGKFSYRGIWMTGVHGIMTANPFNVEYMLKTRFKNFPKGKFYRDRFSDLLGDGIFNADGELWKEQRQAATWVMHSSRFVEYALQTTQYLVQNKLLKLLDKLTKCGEEVDLQDVLLRFTFDNICTAAFDVNPGCLDINLPDVPVARAFDQANEVTLYRFLVPPFVWKLMKFFGVGSEKKLKEAVELVHEFAKKIVTKRMSECWKLGGLKDRQDLLSRLVDIKSPGEQGIEKRFSIKFLQDFIVSFVIAGRDTSALALSWFFWLIDKHPVVENRILAEINEIISDRQSEGKHLNHTEFTVDELNRMVYLQAALSESLRLYPSVPVNFKEVQQDDALPDGTVIAKGAKIVFSIYAMARIEGIWGKDCREFKPERWIKDREFIFENHFKYAVFNAGPRLCLGKKFAYMQMKMVAASILSKYSVKVVQGHPVVPKLTTTLYMKHGLSVTIKPRSTPKSYH